METTDIGLEGFGIALETLSASSDTPTMLGNAAGTSSSSVAKKKTKKTAGGAFESDAVGLAKALGAELSHERSTPREATDSYAPVSIHESKAGGTFASDRDRPTPLEIREAQKKKNRTLESRRKTLKAKSVRAGYRAFEKAKSSRRGGRGGGGGGGGDGSMGDGGVRMLGGRRTSDSDLSAKSSDAAGAPKPMLNRRISTMKGALKRAKRNASGRMKNRQQMFGVDGHHEEEDDIDEEEMAAEAAGDGATQLVVVAEESTEIGSAGTYNNYQLATASAIIEEEAEEEEAWTMRPRAVSKRSSFDRARVFDASFNGDDMPNGKATLTEDEVVDMIATRLAKADGGGSPSGFDAEVAAGVSVDLGNASSFLTFLQSASPKPPPRIVAAACEVLDTQPAADALLKQVTGNNGALPESTLLEVKNQTADAVGVLLSAFNTLEAYIMSMSERTATFEKAFSKMRARDGALDEAVARAREWKMQFPPAVAEMDQAEVTKLSLSASPNKLTIHRVVGTLKLLIATSESEEDKAKATALLDDLMPKVSAAAKVMAARLVPRVNANADSNDATYTEQAGDAAGPAAAAALARVAAAAENVPQNATGADGATVIATEENLQQLTFDPNVGYSATTAPYAVHAEWIGRKTSLALYLIANTVVGKLPGIEVDPAPPKMLGRYIYKGLVKYEGDFSKCYDGARITVNASSIDGIASVVESFVASALVVIVKLENRFDPSIEMAPERGQYRDVAMHCLVKVGGVYRRCEVLVTLKSMSNVRDGFTGDAGGHRLYDAACMIEAFSPGNTSYDGKALSHELYDSLGFGVLLDVKVTSLNFSTSAGAFGAVAKGKVVFTTKKTKGVPESIDSLAKALSESSCRLKKLVLVNCNIDGPACAKFARAIKSNESIETLHLEGNPLGDEGGLAIADVLKTNRSVSIINLDSTGLGDDAGVALADAVAVNPSLIKFTAKHNRFGEDTGTRLGAALAKNPNLIDLDLTDNALCSTASALASGLSSPKCALFKLSLAANIIGDGPGEIICTAMQNNSVTGELHLRNTRLGPRSGHALATALQASATMTIVDLWGCKIGDAAGVTFGKALERNRSLTKLFLNSAEIGEKGGQAFAAALAVNTTLEELHLKYNNLGNAAGVALGAALKKNGALTLLDLFRNKLGDKGGAAIGLSLADNEVLCKLNVGFNALGEEAGVAFGQGLAGNQCLEHLNLGGNGQAMIPKRNRAFEKLMAKHKDDAFMFKGLGEKGGTAIADALRENTVLTDLHIGANRIGHSGGLALAAAMTVNYSLERLNMTFNEFDMEARAALTETKNNYYTCEIAM